MATVRDRVGTEASPSDRNYLDFHDRKLEVELAVRGAGSGD